MRDAGAEIAGLGDKALQLLSGPVDLPGKVIKIITGPGNADARFKISRRQPIQNPRDPGKSPLNKKAGGKPDDEDEDKHNPGSAPERIAQELQGVFAGIKRYGDQHRLAFLVSGNQDPPVFRAPKVPFETDRAASGAHDLLKFLRQVADLGEGTDDDREGVCLGIVGLDCRRQTFKGRIDAVENCLPAKGQCQQDGNRHADGKNGS
jgi:hypothetical protein